LDVEVVFFTEAGFLPAITFFGGTAFALVEAVDFVAGDLAAGFLMAVALTVGAAFAFTAGFLAVLGFAAVAFVVAVLAGRALVAALVAALGAAFAGLFYSYCVNHYITCSIQYVHGPPWRPRCQWPLRSWGAISPAQKVLRSSHQYGAVRNLRNNPPTLRENKSPLVSAGGEGLAQMTQLSVVHGEVVFFLNESTRL
jgi:hypothetical protein